MMGMTADLPVFDEPVITFTMPFSNLTMRGSSAVLGQRISLRIWKYIRTELAGLLQLDELTF